MEIPLDPTKYNEQKKQEAMTAKRDKTIADIATVEKMTTKTMLPSPIQFMDAIENVIKACGGESKVNFMDVTHSFIKVQTRVPLSANLFQFMPESDDNPRFHKVVTKILLLCPQVTGVRWLSVDGNTFLLVSMDLEAKE